MSKYLVLLKYHFALTTKSAKLIMPLVFWVLYMPVSYTIFPLDVVSSFISSALVLFAIMAWIGISYYDIEDMVSEQLLILRIGSEFKVYMSKILFLFIICIGMTLIGIIAPLIQVGFYGGQVFTRTLTITDLCSSFFLHLFLGMMGAAFGGLFHPRIIKNRRAASLLLLLIVIISFIKISIVNGQPVLKLVLLILPPVSDCARIFYNQNIFTSALLLQALGISALYSLICVALQITLLIRKKF